MRRKIIFYSVLCLGYLAATISLILPIDAIGKNEPFFNHFFLLVWAVIAMFVTGFWSNSRMKGGKTKRPRKILADAIIAGVVVYSGLALFLIVLGDLYRETLSASPFRVSDWKVLVFVLESSLLFAGSVVVIRRTID